jgi:type II secretory pathway component PulK
MKTAKTGRNDPCPCGSGRKYKQCCEGKAAEKTTFLTKWIALIAGILAVLAAVGTIALFFTNDRSNGSPRRVWSPEHGHWHDIR